MRRTLTTMAYVLKTVAYRDRDLIVTFLSERDGQFCAIARNARGSTKRFAGGLTPLRRLEIRVTFQPAKDLAHLEASEAVFAFAGLENSYEKISAASYGTELCRDILRDGVAESQTYGALDSFYDHLSQAEDDPYVLRVLIHHFELTLIAMQGVQPNFQACHRCYTPVKDLSRLRCHRDGHGLICNACLRPAERSGVIEDETLALLQYLEAPGPSPPASITSEEALAQARRVIDASLRTVLNNEVQKRPILDPFSMIRGSVA